MPNKGRKVPEWVNYRIKDVAINLRNSSRSLRPPTAQELHRELRKELMEITDNDGIKREYPWVAENIPSLRHVATQLRELKKIWAPISDIEQPWSLGVSQDANISDEATGAIMEVWEWAMLDAAADPLSIRTARWVSKLRWVPKAGGSPLGKAKDPKKLYHFASLYSGRERQVELIKDKKGMRSGVIDAKLMLGDELSFVYRRLGFLSDDEGINHEEDLALVAPEYRRFMHAKGRFDAGLTPFNRHDGQRLAERFSVFGTPENVALAEQIFNGAMKALTKDPRFRSLRASAWKACLHTMMDDFTASFRETRNCLAWNPPIEATLVRHTQ